MSIRKTYLPAILSTLLLSGAAIADGTTSDLETDMMYGHSSDHKDSALVNSSPSQPADPSHSSEKDGEDIVHQMATDGKELKSSPSSPPDQHHVSADNTPDITHEVRDH